MRQLFVIMPITGSVDASHKQAVIQRIASLFGLSVRLPSYDPKSPTFDLREVLASLRSSEMVLADLSEQRPSCYFELGLAEAMNCSIVLVAARGTPVHQTSLRHEVEFYDAIDKYGEVVQALVARAIATL